MNLRSSIYKIVTGENLSDVKKALEFKQEYQESMRPFQDFMDISGVKSTQENTRRTYYNLAMESDLIQLIVNALNGEIFRNGVEVKERFTKKCVNPKCLKEFDIEPTENKCDECGKKLRDPEYSQKKILKDRLFEINRNEQTLTDVLKEGNTDVERIDDMFFLISYEYDYTRTGVILEQKFTEMTRIFPINVKILADKMSRLGRDENENKIYFCPKHRDRVINETQLKEKRCPTCNGELFRAYYSIGGFSSEGKKKYFAKHEVIHTSKYQPSLKYGLSNVVTCANKLITLNEQDKYIRDCYVGKRNPNTLILISTPNYESFNKQWEARAEKAKAHPNMIWPIVNENKDAEGKTKDWVQVVDLMKTPKEMEMIPLREEYRKFIGALYRVMPIWMSDSGKGVGQEGLQIVVTNRGIIEGQGTINNKILKKLSEYMGSYDYFYELVPNEKRDELAELQIDAQKIMNAQNMELMGFKPKIDEEGNFSYEDADLSTQEIDPAGKTPNQNGIIGNTNEQRFEGESVHDHSSEGQRMEGESQDVHRNLEVILKREVEETKKEFKLKFIEKKDSMTDLVNFAKLSLFKKVFDNLSKAQSDKIKSMFLKALVLKTGYRELTKKILKITGEDKTGGEIENIVRTEMNALKNKSREFTFKQADPKGERKYSWISSPDSRRTDTCKRISLRTAKGVSLEKLKEIVKEESKKDFPEFIQRDFQAHYGCRSTFSPKV